MNKHFVFALLIIFMYVSPVRANTEPIRAGFYWSDAPAFEELLKLDDTADVRLVCRSAEEFDFSLKNMPLEWKTKEAMKEKISLKPQKKVLTVRIVCGTQKYDSSHYCDTPDNTLFPIDSMERLKMTIELSKSIESFLNNLGFQRVIVYSAGGNEMQSGCLLLRDKSAR
ncbi:MAG: hypothetical protein KIT34_03495 [Cyanobacteria bacterium TGS_CYA1]|nr:hypothetical protein [Cyanobacteria bacterium TGS_CYA1]